jgi:hypothetical protein
MLEMYKKTYEEMTQAVLAKYYLAYVSFSEIRHIRGQALSAKGMMENYERLKSIS